MRRWPLLLLALGAFDAQAAPPQESDVAAYQALATMDARLATVGYRLATANAPYCAKTPGYNAGWVLHDIAQYPDGATAKAAFGFATPVAVAAVVPDGEAEKQGVRPGDALVRVGNRDISGFAQERPVGTQRLDAVRAFLDDLWGPGYLVPVRVQRDGATRELLIQLNPVCASHFWVDVKSRPDAGADGQQVRMTSALMAFVADDDELAAVAAHEMAHNLLRHPQELAAVVSKKTSAIRATEIEADRLSVWLMANAGYDPRAALRFTERYGRKFGLGLFSDGTHPRWKKRVESMEKELRLMAQTTATDGRRDPPLLSAYRQQQ